MLRTLSPLHITAPSTARLDLGSMEITYSEKGKSIPLTSIQKINVMGDDGALSSVPVIAANNIAGRLRRHAASIIIEVLEGKGQKVTLQTYSALMCGAATGKPDLADIMFEEYREVRGHPYIGLFGGGPRMMRRNLRGYNAIPYTPETRFMFDRIGHPMFDERTHATSQDLRRLRQIWVFTRNDDLRSLTNIAQAARSVEDFETSIRDRQASILIDRHSKESGVAEQSNRNSTKTIWAMEFVIPGVVFPLTFDLEVNEAQLGLFLLALDSFAKSERIGANVRNGMGQFALNEVLIADCNGAILSSGFFNNSRLLQDYHGIQDYLIAWTNARNKITGADLNRLFDPRVDESKAQKTSKKAKSE